MTTAIRRTEYPTLVVPMFPTPGGLLQPRQITEIARVARTVRTASPVDFSCGDYLKYLEEDEA